VIDERGPQVSIDVWNDQGFLYCLQHGEFLHDATFQERHRVVHQMTRFHWEDDLIFSRSSGIR